MRLIASSFLIACVSVTVLGCGSTVDFVEGYQPRGSEAVLYPEGWTKLTLRGFGYKQEIDGNGHFTGTNGCRKDTYGYLEPDNWNPMAAALNHGAKAPLLPEEKCYDAPRGKFDGDAELTMESGPARVVLDYRGGKYCSKLPDSNHVQALIKAIETALVKIEKEDCAP